MRTIVLAAALVAPISLHAEDVPVEYRGYVDLDEYECFDSSRSSFVREVCYLDGSLILLLDDTYYEYCDVEEDAVSDLVEAPSIGRFFNANIRGEYPCP